MACLVCRSTALATLYEGVRDHYGVAADPYRFLRCLECGSATLDPLPPPATLASLYSPAYTFKPAGGPVPLWYGLLATLEWRLFYRQGYRQRLEILRRLTGLRSGRLLEVGCGGGLFLSYLREAGYDVEGIELSETDAEYARRRFGLAVAHGTLETEVLERDRYDAILLVYVLEHMLDPHDALARILRTLKPGGWVVLGLPLIDSGQAKLLGARWSAVTEAPRHVMIPSFGGAWRLLEGAGFRDIRAAPAPLWENAGHIALSLLPDASTPRACGPQGSLRGLLRRLAGALLLAPGVLIAWAERWPGGGGARTGTMFFCGRK